MVSWVKEIFIFFINNKIKILKHMKTKKHKFWRYFFWSIVVIFIAIQFIPVKMPKATQNNPDDFLANVEMPASVATMFKTSCYDCHSNETKYPWYAHIAPSSWLLSSDIREGRYNLNFSNWKSLDKAQQIALLSNIRWAVTSGDMPFWAYPIMHPKAKMTKADRKEMADWTRQYENKIFYSR